MAGQQVAAEKWTISAGSSRKDFSNVNGLQQGIYILSIRDNAGNILYNGKVIKQ